MATCLVDIYLSKDAHLDKSKYDIIGISCLCIASMIRDNFDLDTLSDLVENIKKSDVVTCIQNMLVNIYVYKVDFTVPLDFLSQTNTDLEIGSFICFLISLTELPFQLRSKDIAHIVTEIISRNISSRTQYALERIFSTLDLMNQNNINISFHNSVVLIRKYLHF